MNVSSFTKTKSLGYIHLLQIALKTSDLSRSQAETLGKSQDGVLLEQYQP